MNGSDKKNVKKGTRSGLTMGTMRKSQYEEKPIRKYQKIAGEREGKKKERGERL